METSSPISKNVMLNQFYLQKKTNEQIQIIFGISIFTLLIPVLSAEKAQCSIIQISLMRDNYQS